VNFFDGNFNAKTSSLYSTRFFTGQVRDNETGLMLYRNRVYHPTLGRFVQRDPIGYDAGDVNLVRYVRNIPIWFYDSFGLQYSQAVEDMNNTIIIAEDMIKAQRENACKKFKEWLENERKNVDWISKLDPCPCKITIKISWGAASL
jgi:RHS repeat-associated protein